MTHQSREARLLAIQRLTDLQEGYEQREERYTSAALLLRLLVETLESDTPGHLKVRAFEDALATSYETAIIELPRILSDALTALKDKLKPRRGRPAAHPFAAITSMLTETYQPYEAMVRRCQQAVECIQAATRILEGSGGTVLDRLDDLRKIVEKAEGLGIEELPQQLESIWRLIIPTPRVTRRKPAETRIIGKSYTMPPKGIKIMREAFSNKGPKDPLMVLDQYPRHRTAVRNTIMYLWYWRRDKLPHGFNEHPQAAAELGEFLRVKDPEIWEWIVRKTRAKTYLTESEAKLFLSNG